MIFHLRSNLIFFVRYLLLKICYIYVLVALIFVISLSIDQVVDYSNFNISNFFHK